MSRGRDTDTINTSALEVAESIHNRFYNSLTPKFLKYALDSSDFIFSFYLRPDDVKQSLEYLVDKAEPVIKEGNRVYGAFVKRFLKKHEGLFDKAEYAMLESKVQYNK